MNNALLILVADGGVAHTTWSPWHAAMAYAAIIGLVIWLFYKALNDPFIDAQREPDDTDPPNQP